MLLANLGQQLSARITISQLCSPGMRRQEKGQYAQLREKYEAIIFVLLCSSSSLLVLQFLCYFVFLYPLYYLVFLCSLCLIFLCPLCFIFLCLLCHFLPCPLSHFFQYLLCRLLLYPLCCLLLYLLCYLVLCSVPFQLIFHLQLLKHSNKLCQMSPCAGVLPVLVLQSLFIHF